MNYRRSKQYLKSYDNEFSFLFFISDEVLLLTSLDRFLCILLFASVTTFLANKLNMTVATFRAIS